MTKNLTFIGTGYVGLVSGTGMAELGHAVTCMDIDQAKIDALNERGEIPIYEPGLPELVAKNVAANRLSFTADLASCVPQADAVFIGVGTPQSEDGAAKLDYVYQAAEDIAPHLTGFTVIIIKSTVPVGTNRQVEQIIRDTNPDADFAVASNPEFLREGKAVDDFLKPDRIVVGVENERARELIKALYAPQTEQGYPLQLYPRFETSEIIKYAANAFLAMKITFINEIAALCETCGADVDDIAAGIGSDGRIGPLFLKAGPGYGGSCFPKDTHALAYIGQQHGTPQQLVEQTIDTNEAVKLRMVDKIVHACGDSVAGKTIAVWGLAFKPGTDDMREAAALTILPALAEQGAKLQVHDPAAMANAQQMMPDFEYCDDKETALTNADALLILTEWEDYQEAPAATAKLSSPVLIDLRNMFDTQAIAAQGIQYHCIGKPTLKAKAQSQENAA